MKDSASQGVCSVRNLPRSMGTGVMLFILPTMTQLMAYLTQVNAEIPD